MLEHVAKKITAFISENYNSDPELNSVYQYGIEIFLSSVLNFALILTVGFIISDIVSSLIFLFIFIFMRTFSGGYHANTYFMCNATFVLTYLSVYELNTIINLFVPTNYLIIVCAIFSIVAFIPVILYAPVKNKHKPIMTERKKLYCKCSISIYIIMVVIAAITYSYTIFYSSFIIVAITAVSVMILIGVFLQRKEEQK